MAENIYDPGQDCTAPSGGWTFIGFLEGTDSTGIYRKVHDTVESALVSRGTAGFNDVLNDVGQPLGASPDMWRSIRAAKKFVDNNQGVEITMVGHSKGGAEAILNALETNKNCIVFNPAAPNPAAYGINATQYTGSMTSYIVRGEILSSIFYLCLVSTYNNMILLPTQYPAGYSYNPTNIDASTTIFNNIHLSLYNHSISTVIKALQKWRVAQGGPGGSGTNTMMAQ